MIWESDLKVSGSVLIFWILEESHRGCNLMDCATILCIFIQFLDINTCIHLIYKDEIWLWYFQNWKIIRGPFASKVGLGAISFHVPRKLRLGPTGSFTIKETPIFCWITVWQWFTRIMYLLKELGCSCLWHCELSRVVFRYWQNVRHRRVMSMECVHRDAGIVGH